MKIKIEECFKMLGHPVRDKVTGYSGIATSLSFDLYGCIQVLINPGMNTEGKLGEQIWFDISRLEHTNTKQVMSHPFELNYSSSEVDIHKGPESKPPTNAS